VEGILKEGEVREFTLTDGEDQKFGLSILNHHTFSYVEDIDDECFKIRNLDGKLFMIDQGINCPSKISIKSPMKFRLLKDDYIDLGNDVLLQVTEATAHKQPKPNTSEVINIRYLETSYSKAGSEVMENPDNLIKDGETPHLQLTFQKGMMNGTVKNFAPPEGKWAENGYLIGRDKADKVHTRIHPGLDAVSRQHCYI
jgi:hypothetical protein